MIETNNSINEIHKAHGDKRLIPFIGSGFSKPLGLPDWGQLVSTAAINIGFDPELFLLHGSYPQLLEYIYKEHEWYLYGGGQPYTHAKKPV